MKPDFLNIADLNLRGSDAPKSYLDIPMENAEQIPLKSVFSKTDYPETHFGAGEPPYVRGPYASMYIQKPWTIRQYAGFLSPLILPHTVGMTQTTPEFLGTLARLAWP